MKGKPVPSSVSYEIDIINGPAKIFTFGTGEVSVPSGQDAACLVRVEVMEGLHHRTVVGLISSDWMLDLRAFIKAGGTIGLAGGMA